MKPQEKLHANVTLNRNDRFEVTIEGEIADEAIKKFRPQAIKYFSDGLKLPGFRPGHIPEPIVVKEAGEVSILEKTAELAIDPIYKSLLEEHRLDIIGRPSVTFTKLIPGSPVAFKIEAAEIPAIEIPEDYKSKVAVPPRAPGEVSDKEVEEFIATLTKSEEGKDPVVLTDETVKKWGDFKDVPDFKAKMKVELQKDKERKALEKRRAEIAEKLVALVPTPMPRILIESELDRMMGQFKSDIERLGMKFGEYLSKLKKTEEDLRKEWDTEAEKRALLQMLLAKISQKENIIPDPNIVESEVKHLVEHFKDLDPTRARIYVESQLTNQKVFEFLENQK